MLILIRVLDMENRLPVINIRVEVSTFIILRALFIDDPVQGCNCVVDNSARVLEPDAKAALGADGVGVVSEFLEKGYRVLGLERWVEPAAVVVVITVN